MLGNVISNAFKIAGVNFGTVLPFIDFVRKKALIFPGPAFKSKSYEQSLLY